jgi:H+/Na+-translocating ferredoxin:NAD+ oxidoreductase subunit G
MSFLFNKQNISSILPLTITSLVCFIFIIIVHNISKDKISINKERAALAVINEVMPIKYDNDLFNDNVIIDVPAYINPTKSITAYRARVNNQPRAVSLMPVMTKGYNGNISLIIGIAYDGALTGVRILQHNETEGFGDKAHQDKTDWLLGFNNHSFEGLPEEKWAVKKDGGEFDQLSGATITSRSIINIVYKVLEYYSENRNSFYENQ